jgi:hypothetical protein
MRREAYLGEADLRLSEFLVMQAEREREQHQLDTVPPTTAQVHLTVNQLVSG